MATLKLEVGKYYKTRDGQRVGPMAVSKGHNDYFVADGFGLFTSDGVFVWVLGGLKSAPAPWWDLIAEWTDAPTGPVRTVNRTTREIVPGEYGAVNVFRADDGLEITISLHTDYPADIRAAIATLTEIADALEEKA